MGVLTATIEIPLKIKVSRMIVRDCTGDTFPFKYLYKAVRNVYPFINNLEICFDIDDLVINN